MGLLISHGAFEGSYHAFNRWREFLIDAIGGSHVPFVEEWEFKYPEGKYDVDFPGMHTLFMHSDADGEIEPNICAELILTLEANMEMFEEYEKSGNMKIQGHIANAGGFVAVTKKFIQGCKSAVERNESLVFM